jgi:hypothetical protein
VGGRGGAGAGAGGRKALMDAARGPRLRVWVGVGVCGGRALACVRGVRLRGDVGRVARAWLGWADVGGSARLRLGGCGGVGRRQLRLERAAHGVVAQFIVRGGIYDPARYFKVGVGQIEDRGVSGGVVWERGVERVRGGRRLRLGVGRRCY